MTTASFLLIYMMVKIFKSKKANSFSFNIAHDYISLSIRPLQGVSLKKKSIYDNVAKNR